MISNTYIFYDFETGSRNAKKTQPIQLAAVAIHSRKLEIIPNSEFNSMICAYDDEEAIAKGLDPLEDGALKVNKKTREEIFAAPHKKIVWKQFQDYVDRYNYNNNKWSAPIMVGFNNNGFDDIIIDSLAAEFGPYDKEYQKQNLFHPIYNFDLFKMVLSWFENSEEVKKYSMDYMREYLGMDQEGAHDALVDVKQGAEMFIRFLKLQRTMSRKVKFKGAFSK